MLILSIDTSCDETSVAVTDGVTVLSNVLWSQASLHAEFGGVFPSLAKRAHEEHIEWVIKKALGTSKKAIEDMDAIAVTIGPGLAIALEVGINKAKELAKKYNKTLIAVNHIEGHLLSPLAVSKNSQPTTHNQLLFPALSLVASGKHTDLIYAEKIGSYKIIAHTVDDAVGEALDKAARMLGFGYPGGAILEKIAKGGNLMRYSLPIPMIGRENQMEFSYSGLKTALYRLVENQKPLTKQKVADIAACFQDKAFTHIERLVKKALKSYKVKSFLFGGGVSSNVELRNRLRKICKENGIQLLVPYTKKLCTDNAGMIGIVAYFKHQRNECLNPDNIDVVDRVPRAKIDQLSPWQL